MRYLPVPKNLGPWKSSDNIYFFFFLEPILKFNCDFRNRIKIWIPFIERIDPDKNNADLQQQLT